MSDSWIQVEKIDLYNPQELLSYSITRISLDDSRQDSEDHCQCCWDEMKLSKLSRCTPLDFYRPLGESELYARKSHLDEYLICDSCVQILYEKCEYCSNPLQTVCECDECQDFKDHWTGSLYHQRYTGCSSKRLPVKSN